MTAEDLLRSNEEAALEDSQGFFYSGKGKLRIDDYVKKSKSFSAIGFITAIIVVFAVFFSSGNLIPSAISERLIEETDVQYADAVESKKLVFQQALYDGDVPENTIELLKKDGVEVISTEGGEQALVINGRTVTAKNFIVEVNNDVNLYNAFNNATYSRAAYYFDESATKVFRKIGTSRNNYTSESDFDEVMSSLVGSGSNVTVNNVGVTERTEEVDGETRVYQDYETVGADAISSGDATAFIKSVGEKNPAETTTDATLNSADALKVADTISKEQRSSLFFLAFMENISKMKAGDGNESKINDAMNYLNEEAETEVLDTKTGEVIKVKGTPLDSPSLYAVLADADVDVEAVSNYSSERVLKTVENRLATDNGKKAIDGTIASTDSRVKGAIGRFLNGGDQPASEETLSVVNSVIDKSLVNNSYETIQGVDAGEFLVEGAVNTGKLLAKASGATGGDAEAAADYARLNSTVLAMDAAADRANRSPFDITSKNTFLGSIVYKMAIVNRGSSSPFVSSIRTISSVMGSSVAAILPASYADAPSGYLTKHGECETYNNIGMVGSAQCAEVAVFDTTTLNDTFNDAGFVDFVNANTTLGSNGSRTINQKSVLADFIIYNNERVTPLGVVDGGILDSLNKGSSSVSFVSSIVSMIRSLFGTSDSDKRIASGAMYVNSRNNSDWQNYKYAQRYVSLARATESLRRYSGDANAYNNIKFFEGDENPVIAFIDNYYATASR